MENPYGDSYVILLVKFNIKKINFTVTKTSKLETDPNTFISTTRTTGYWEKINHKYYKMYNPKHPKGYMFLNEYGNPLKVERLRVFFRRYRRKAGISGDFIVHSLRHSFATKLVEEGVALVQVLMII